MMTHKYKFIGKKDKTFHWYCEKCWKTRTIIDFDKTECNDDLDLSTKNDQTAARNITIINAQ